MKKCTEKWMQVFVCAGCAAAMIFAGCSGQKPLSDRFVEETVKKTAEEIIRRYSPLRPSRTVAKT